MITRGGRPTRALAALVASALAFAAASCSAGDDDAAPNATSTTTAVRGQWLITEAEGAVTVDAATYRFDVGPDGILSIAGPDQGGETTGGIETHILRDGERQSVGTVDDAKLGLDHVTLFVTFTDGTTGRVELGAATPDTIAVSVTADDPTGVTGTGIDLEPAEVDGTYRFVDR